MEPEYAPVRARSQDTRRQGDSMDFKEAMARAILKDALQKYIKLAGDNTVSLGVDRWKVVQKCRDLEILLNLLPPQ